MNERPAVLDCKATFMDFSYLRIFVVVDMIAIPDFAAGAMENWGLITYRETALLFSPNKSSESNKQRVAVVVSHELVHQVGFIDW